MHGNVNKALQPNDDDEQVLSLGAYEVNYLQ